MALKESLTDVQMKGMNAVHKTLLTVSGGRWGTTLGNMPVVELHTVGRSSGKRRSTMLTTPVQDDGTYVLVASKGGDDRDPDWFRNLVANPDIELTVDGDTIPLDHREQSSGLFGFWIDRHNSGKPIGIIVKNTDFNHRPHNQTAPGRWPVLILEKEGSGAD